MAELKIENISKLVTNDTLQDIFKTLGTIVYFDVSVDLIKRDGSKVATIIFLNTSEAEEALLLDGTEIGDRSFTVKRSFQPARFCSKVDKSLSDTERNRTLFIRSKEHNPTHKKTLEKLKSQQSWLIIADGQDCSDEERALVEGGEGVGLVEYEDRDRMNIERKRLVALGFVAEEACELLLTNQQMRSKQTSTIKTSGGTLKKRVHADQKYSEHERSRRALSPSETGRGYYSSSPRHREYDRRRHPGRSSSRSREKDYDRQYRPRDDADHTRGRDRERDRSSPRYRDY